MSCAGVPISESTAGVLALAQILTGISADL